MRAREGGGVGGRERAARWREPGGVGGGTVGENADEEGNEMIRRERG